MAAPVDLVATRKLLPASQWSAGRLLVCSLLLLLGLVISRSPSYAATAANTDNAVNLSNGVLADTATALGLPEGSLTAQSPSSATAADAAKTSGAATEPVKPSPVISGESTNNAQIETSPTPQKDQDIRQRIDGIFSEIEGLQAVTVSVTQGVVSLAGETANEKKPNRRSI